MIEEKTGDQNSGVQESGELRHDDGFAMELHSI